MSESSSESYGDYIDRSPSPATRRNLLFLDMELPLPDDISSRNNLLPESFSRSTRSAASGSSEPGDPCPFTSTPELSFAASSSPYLSPAKGRPFPLSASAHLPRVGDIRLVNPASDHASFGRHLDLLLREVVEQQNISKISSNARIQSEHTLDYKLQVLCDASSDLGSVDVPTARARSFPLLHQDWRQLSPPDDGDTGGCVFAVALQDAGSVPTRNKRKALATIVEECFNPAVDFLTRGECLARRADSYMSASDCVSPLVSPLPLRYSDTHYPRLKRQKCRSFDGTHPPGVPVLSPLAKSSSLSKIYHKSSSFPRWKEHGSNIDRVTTPPYFSDTRNKSTTGIVSPYPPTQPATPVPSPVPALSPQYFQEMEIPRVFASSEDAAEARLNVLLKKDVLYLRRKGSGALAALGFAPRDSFIMEVIAWILTVEPPQASTINVSTEARVHSRDLYEQLTTHNDTRYLAALIFTSFFFTVSARTGEEPPKVADYPDVDQWAVESDDIQKMVVWDYAVSAIALAVKIHRDNLPPLRPIYARHFLAMAPHEMSFDDLELSERDLLECLSYDLGMPTPQAILDELCLALPTLRQVLHFAHAWEDVLSLTWKQLLAAAHSPDILRFPVSLLTATALIEAITGVVCGHLSLTKLRIRAGCFDNVCNTKHVSDNTKALFLEEKPTNEESRILHETRGLLVAIRTVLGLSEDKVGECEDWLATVRLVSKQPLRSKYFSAVPM